VSAPGAFSELKRSLYLALVFFFTSYAPACDFYDSLNAHTTRRFSPLIRGRRWFLRMTVNFFARPYLHEPACLVPAKLVSSLQWDFL